LPKSSGFSEKKGESGSFFCLRKGKRKGEEKERTSFLFSLKEKGKPGLYSDMATGGRGKKKKERKEGAARRFRNPRSSTPAWERD